MFNVCNVWCYCWGNSGTNVVGVTNHFLVDLKYTLWDRNYPLKYLGGKEPETKKTTGLGEKNQTLFFCYNIMARKWSLMIFFYTHSIVSPSAFIKEATSCNRCNQHRDAQRQCMENESLKHSLLSGRFSSNCFLQCERDYTGNKGEKSKEPDM